MLNPPRRQPMAPKVVSKSETIRLVILGLGAVVLLAVIGTSLLKSTQPQRPAENTIDVPPGDAPGGGGIPDPKPVVPNKIPPFEPKAGMFDEVVDLSGEIEKAPFYYAVHKVAATAQDEIMAKAEKNVPYGDLLKYAAQKRGTYIRIRGSLLYLKKNMLPENRSGVRNAYLGGLVGNDQKIYTFLTIDIPNRIAMQDVIEVHGIFFKHWRYQNRNNRWVSGPYFVAKTFRKIPPRPPQKPMKIFGVELKLGNHIINWWELAAVLILVIFAPAMFFLVRYERRKYAEFKKEMIEKKKKKRAALPGKPEANVSPARAEAPGTAPPVDGKSPAEPSEAAEGSDGGVPATQDQAPEDDGASPAEAPPPPEDPAS